MVLPVPAEPEVSAVVSRLLEYKRALIAMDAETMALMAERWYQLEVALEAQVALLVQEIGELKAAGEAVHINRIRRLTRYKSLLGQLDIEMAEYLEWALVDITNRQLLLGKMGIDNAVGAIRVALTEAGKGVGSFFDKIPVSAVENMVGMTSAGPLADLLVEAYPITAEQMSQALIEGVALGLPPDETARRMANGMAEGLNRITVIARTEQLRVYREASRQQYEESGAVRGYQRLASKQPNTCMACIALDGEVYPTKELMNVHPQDRCSMIPLVRGALPIQRETAAEWFERQDPELQKEMMGPGKFALYKEGRVNLQGMASKYVHPTWGPSVNVTSLKDLV